MAKQIIVRLPAPETALTEMDSAFLTPEVIEQAMESFKKIHGKVFLPPVNWIQHNLARYRRNQKIVLVSGVGMVPYLQQKFYEMLGVAAKDLSNILMV